MTERTLLVVNGFMKLSAEERSKAIEILREFLAEEARRQKTIQEGIEKQAIMLGPLSFPCPCCRRG